MKNLRVTITGLSFQCTSATVGEQVKQMALGATDAVKHTLGLGTDEGNR